MLDVSASPVSMLADEMEKKRWLAEDPGIYSMRIVSFHPPVATDADGSQATSMAMLSPQVKLYSLRVVLHADVLS